jgi:pre-rRNA-processing protein TSR3
MEPDTEHEPLSVLIIVRRGENRAQCTIQPLRGTPGLEFLRYPLSRKPDLSRHLLLAPDAPALTRADAGRPLVLLDANWHHAPRMRRAIEPVDARSIPPGWRTAYPRRSKIHADPAAGLATVEALFAATCVLGCRDDSLLRLYPCRDAFFALNRDMIEQEGCRGRSCG